MLRSVSFSASGQEQGIHQYIPPDLRRMFYKNPAAIHASHNGLDPYGFMTRGLVLYLPLWAVKESGNNTFKSVDANQFTCTQIGALWQPDGRYFDGTDDRIACGTSTLLYPTVYTVEVWAKSKTLTANDIVVAKGYTTGDTNQPFFLGNITATGDHVVFGYYDGSWVVAESTSDFFDQSVWCHLVGVFDGTTYHIYFNGSSEDTQAGSRNADNSSNLYIGCRDSDGTPTDFFNGTIGEVRMYNRVLSAGEITHNYNVTKWRY